ncbi:MAG: zinc ribbon domain-containing protein [Verrucomicrobiota bacterium]
MTMLICPECQNENEVERIYCHDCGAKLDRSRLKKDKIAVAEEKPEEIQKRVRRMFGGQRARFKQVFFKLSKVALGACAAAAVVLLVSPPEVPEKKKFSELPAQINLDLENATMAHHGTQLRYTEEQVNSYLAGALRSKQAALDKPLLHFERALVKMDEGLCQITAERSVFGYSLYTTALFAVSTADGKFTASSRGGSIGRMPIHPEIMKYGDVIFADLWKALDRERKLVVKLAATEFHPQAVVLTAAIL